MNEQAKQEVKPVELTKEQLERVSGGFDIEQVLSVTEPIKPPAATVNPFE